MARLPWVAKADEGVRFGIQVFSRGGHRDPIPAIIDAAQAVERLGFDGFFIPDHPARHPDPWSCLSAIARETERVTLGSVVNCVFYRNPAYLARLAADFDHLSSGRLMLGLGIGWDEGEFRALSVPFLSVAKRQAGLEEAIHIIEGVWGDEPFSFHGNYFRVEAMRVWPRPIQQPRPPIMIGGGGEKRTLRQVARFADACNFGPATLEEIRRKFAVLRQYCTEFGRPYDEILRTYYTFWLIMAPTQRDLEAKLKRYFPAEIAPVIPSMIVYGTPRSIIEYYRLRAAAGVQYFVVQVLDPTDHETLELLANEVMPHVS